MNTCHPGENRLNAWLDDELDAPASADVERHLSACPECTAQADALRSLGQAVRAAPLYFAAPPTLERQVRATLAREANVPSATRWLPVARRLAVAAAILLAVFVGWSLPRGQPGPATLASEVLSAHLRSLMADHLLDVPSSDRHTVKPWFAGKVDFSPDVRDCAADGYPLQGGRLEYLDHRTVAALVYRHDKHVINVFVWPTRDDGNGSPPTGTALDGYHTLTWNAAGLTYWAVSDASESTLRDLQRCLTSHP